MLSQLFSFSGRLSRSQYWKRLGVFIAIVVVLFVVVLLFGTPNGEQRSIGGVPGILLASVFLGGFVIVLSANVRRIHDLNRSGWWFFAYLIGVFVLLALSQLTFTAPDGTATVYRPLGDGLLSYIPVLLALSLLIYMFVSQGFFEGTTGSNKYGPDPKTDGPVDPAVFGR